MEAQLDRILASAKPALQAFEGPLADDLDAALSLSPDNISAQSGALRTKIEETIQTLHRLERIITPPQVLFMDAIFAATNTKVLLCAHRYRLADILEKQGPMTVPALAAAAGMQPAAAQQLVRYLVDELGFFEYVSPATTTTPPAPEEEALLVRNNRPSALLRTDHWSTWHNWVDQYTTTNYAMLEHLPDAVSASSSPSPSSSSTPASASSPGVGGTAAPRSAAPRSAAQRFYDTDDHPYAVMQARGLTAGFHRAIGAFSVAEAPGLLADYAWGEELVGGDAATATPTATLTDVGAGRGDFVAAYLRAFPRARAVAFDLPGTADIIGKRFAEEEDGAVRGRVEVRAGDFFAEGANQIPQSEVYFLRLVLHNWDDERCVAILKRVREAMVVVRGVSRVLVVENVIRDGRLGSFARYGDVRMLTMVRARERTLGEYRGIAARAGFEIVDVVTPRGCLSQVLDLRPVD